MKELKELVQRISKLIDVKSIVTILLTVIFCKLACEKLIDAGQFITIYTIIIGFYFGTQSNKKEVKNDGTNTKEDNVGQ